MANSTSKIMGAGLPALAARHISGTLDDSLTATGNSQATALPVYADNNVVTTAAASTGVILPAGPQPGDDVMISNLGANSLSVYPPVGGQINNVAANGAFAVVAGKSAVFIARNGGLNWVANLSA